MFMSFGMALGLFCVGFSYAYTSPAFISMDRNSSTLHITHHEVALVSGLMPAAALVGSVLGGYLIVKLGRRMTLLVTALPFCGSWFLIIFGVNVNMLYAARIISGLCIGTIALCLPVYMAEACQPELRGILGIVPTLMGNVGILTCYINGKYLEWRPLATVGSVFFVPYFICLIIIRESPAWYLERGERELAEKKLRWMRGGSKANVELELTLMETDVKTKRATIIEMEASGLRNSLRRICLERKNRRALAILLTLMSFQELSGISAVIFYSSQIFQEAGSEDESLDSIVVGTVNVVATLVATMLIERLGRRMLLCISAGIASVSLCTMGTYFFLIRLKVDVSDYTWLPLLSIIVYLIGFSLGFGPIPWLMLGELLPVEIRGVGAALATSVNWLVTFVVATAYPHIVKLGGGYLAFWCYSIASIFAVFFVIAFVPETRGRTLAEIEEYLSLPPRGLRRAIQRFSMAVNSAKITPTGVT